MQDFISVSNTSSVQHSGFSHKDIFYKSKQTNQELKTFFVRFLALQKNQNTDWDNFVKTNQDCQIHITAKKRPRLQDLYKWNSMRIWQDP